MEVWKVYIPHDIFLSSCGFMFGFLNGDRRIVCVTSVSEDFKSSSKDQERDQKLQCIGYWYPDGPNVQVQETKKSAAAKQYVLQPLIVWIDMYLSKDGARGCDLQLREPYGEEFISAHSTCIIYDATELLSSYFLCDHGRRLCITSNFVASCNGLSNVDTLVYYLYKFTQLDVEIPDSSNTCSHHRLIQTRSKCAKGILSVRTLTTFLSYVYLGLGLMLDNRFMNHWFLKAVVNHIAFLHQIKLRYIQVKKSFHMEIEHQFRDVRCLNVQTRLILDMTLGVSLMIFLMWSGATESMAAFVITWADSVVIWLNNLLDWLMGVPAGLKLNSQLDQFLGRFFHYHIYLWTGYLTLLKPVLAPLLWYSSIVGILGVSSQLCLLQDIFSTLTVHIYCFYVYAARLYYFQLYGLSSLWRLFRGKKWNVLRRRVDSASYDVDQLFVGTLLFTILLFLLPTTALYYVVFLGLRGLVLTLTGTVSQTVSVVNTLPIHGLLLRLINSPKITGDVMFTVLPDQTNDKTLFVAMKAVQLPFTRLSSLLQEENLPMSQHPSYTWGSLLHRIFVGELIYPWVEPALNPNSKVM